jgi:predicted esterase YcpF (UPF0227 family)
LIVYLHGFNSSPQSAKARSLRDWLAARGLAGAFVCPRLPHRPAQAVPAIEAAIAAAPPGDPVTFVGSSLGGYYATHFAERDPTGSRHRAVLINPAVRPYELLAPHLGEHQNLYTGERYALAQAHLDELRALEVPAITHPRRYLLLVDEGDEVLDHRQALARYAGATQIVLPGGDHGFSRFDDYRETIARFAGVL